MASVLKPSPDKSLDWLVHLVIYTLLSSSPNVSFVIISHHQRRKGPIGCSTVGWEDIKKKSEVKYPEHIQAFMGGKHLMDTDLDTCSPSPMPGTVRGSIDPSGGVRFHPVVCFEARLSLSIVVGVISDQLRPGHPTSEHPRWQGHTCLVSFGSSFA